MEHNRSQDQQQKDFLAFLFPSEVTTDSQRSHDSQQNDLMSGGSGPSQRLPTGVNNFSATANSNFNPGLNMDLSSMGNFMQGMESTPQAMTAPAQFTPQMLLEQQYKLTQLHQLQQLQNQIQNQIFQQQLALISGQSVLTSPDPNSEPQREQVSSFNGLPTPVSSTELRPMPNPEFMSRMNPTYPSPQQDSFSSRGLDSLPSPHTPAAPNQYLRNPGSMSAPANIVFHTSPMFPHPSPPELDIDISPLTSPWLEAYQQQPSQIRSANKRTISPSADDNAARASRKRQIPSVLPAKKVPRNAKSASSTPLLRSSRSRRNSTVVETDSPSPVDLSMPPPAPPTAEPSPGIAQPHPPEVAPAPEDVRMTPVTPASIMNLGRLGISSSLAPSQSAKPARTDKGKEPAKSKLSMETTTINKGAKKGSMPLISPGPKPILPGMILSHGEGILLIHQAPVAGNPGALSLGSSAMPPPVPLTRKSHKDAEQKRRDSLKTAYDDLRILLPPVPLPSDENFPDEPILPGALPPRGPPKAGGDGPNKGVSKLQLLRCGNDYIRQLKGRVDRRDSEIECLRREVLRLRVLAGADAMVPDGEDLDLERDLDAIEAGSAALGQGSVAGDDDGDEGDE
ncbi:hypothetical protein BV22DRAFT_1134138 [Leucogyrophana mollusca]|uniref:Uncharacterized protein n=1 Tax=Leucogyrophana mollusca TaxID=85980 RepID=A0ACB8B2H4_9AGAM|nr:hypothetical protein BV22DRAFT_1134138 [Leucogyrophana mollusca]